MLEQAGALSTGVAGLLEVLKPWLEGFKDKAWYPRLMWGLAFIFSTAGAWMFNINVLHERAIVHDAFGFIFTGFVCSLGSEVTHRLLEIWRGLSMKANTPPVAPMTTTTTTTPAAKTTTTVETVPPVAKEVFNG